LSHSCCRKSMPPTRAGSRIAVPSPKIMVCRCAGEQTNARHPGCHHVG
jgi:hypothetical protein